MTLSERIGSRDNPIIVGVDECPLGDGCPVCAPVPRPRQPRWIERMNEGKLPNKDLTGKGPDAA